MFYDYLGFKDWYQTGLSRLDVNSVQYDFWFVFVWDTASKVYNVTNFRDTFVSRPFLIKL